MLLLEGNTARRTIDSLGAGGFLLCMYVCVCVCACVHVKTLTVDGPPAESVAAREPMPAWRPSQDDLARIRATMHKFNKDQDALRAEAAAAEEVRWKNLSVSTKGMVKRLGGSRLSGEEPEISPVFEARNGWKGEAVARAEAKQSAGLDMLHRFDEGPTAASTATGWAAAMEQNANGKVEMYPTISTRKAATNRRFHIESPSWEVDPGHDSLSFVTRASKPGEIAGSSTLDACDSLYTPGVYNP